MTSWTAPKLTARIYITARDDRAKDACNLFIYLESANSAFIWQKREEMGDGFSLMQHLHTQNIPIITSEHLNGRFKKKKVISCCSLAERMHFRGMCVA